jgi:DNA-directed RNA polymerase specialized sigma24 family protein
MADAADRRDGVARELEKHRSNLFAFILSVVRDFEVAEAVLARVARARIEPGAGWADWLRAARRAVDGVEGVRLSRQAVDAVARAAEAEPSPAGPDAVRACLSRLGGRTRSALAFRYRDGLSDRHVSRRTKETLTTVHETLARARALLARWALERRP